MEDFLLLNKTRRKTPPFPYKKAKERIVGGAYALSLIFITPAASRRLNTLYRKKGKPANVLAFPLSRKTGEVFIDLATAARDAKKFGVSPARFVRQLFIHALLHLKGHAHGATMERKERLFRKLFGA